MNTRGKRYHPVKPARSYKEQLARLTDIHGLTIGDEARARYILSTVNYYRLTTYGKHLRRADDPDLFLPGVSLETLYSKQPRPSARRASSAKRFFNNMQKMRKAGKNPDLRIFSRTIMFPVLFFLPF